MRLTRLASYRGTRLGSNAITIARAALESAFDREVAGESRRGFEVKSVIPLEKTALSRFLRLPPPLLPYLSLVGGPRSRSCSRGF